MIRTPDLKERDVTATIKGFLESRKWYGVRIQSGVVRGKTGGTFIRMGKKNEGRPDWLWVRGLECLFVEVKAPGKKPSKDQVRWLEWAEIEGIRAIWADSLGSFLVKYQDKIGLR